MVQVFPPKKTKKMYKYVRDTTLNECQKICVWHSLKLFHVQIKRGVRQKKTVKIMLG